MSSEVLSASLEDYLEAIFQIAEAKQVARSKDIAKKLTVNRSSVTGALHALSDRGLVNYVPYDVVTLTAKGGRVARDIVRRHEALREFFAKVLGIERTEAERAACDMEHAMPRGISERFGRFVEFMESCPKVRDECTGDFRRYCEQGCPADDCAECIHRHVRQLHDGETCRRALPGLNTLQKGERGRVVRVTGSEEAVGRLRGLGLVPGAVVEMDQEASGGGQATVTVDGEALCLSSKEVRGVSVEVVS